MEFVTTTQAPQPIGAYAQAVKSGSLIFVSGQLPINAEGVMPGNIQAQTQQSLQNIEEILKASGAQKTNILKVQIFTTVLSDFQKINDEYQLFMGAHTPARAVVEVSSLPKGALVEIDAIAQV